VYRAELAGALTHFSPIWAHLGGGFAGDPRNPACLSDSQQKLTTFR
jgi:hypothetical protein